MACMRIAAGQYEVQIGRVWHLRAWSRNCVINIPTGELAREQSFSRYGLPERILCDNGNPWRGAEEACPYSRLGVWLLQLGVELIHGRVCHPQTQGSL